MFQELQKYREFAHFLFKPTDNLKVVCNAPTDKSGIYLIYGLKNSQTELVYIGCSGNQQKNGSIFIRKAGLGGIKDRLVNGYQFGKIPRRKSWISRMKDDNIDVLKVYWYITHGPDYVDCPRVIEKMLLEKHWEIYQRLPLWNHKR